MSELHALGHASKIPDAPDARTLERVPNPHPDVDYVARFAAPEFTSICPVTGQPDFAHLVIDYAPDQWLVESKSLKLHLASFRNHGAFHEDRRPRQAALAQDRRLLVSARRHSDRRVLADRGTAQGRLGARSGCGALSRARLRI
jgi:7-cyano-7-deazaguanine reductase